MKTYMIVQYTIYFDDQLNRYFTVIVYYCVKRLRYSRGVPVIHLIGACGNADAEENSLFLEIQIDDPLSGFKADA